MSEYYKLRRRKIVDAMALAGFVIGFIVPAYAAGKGLVEGFETGFETAGLKYFVITLLGNAIIGGIIGIGVGYVVGLIWQKIHMRLRPDLTGGARNAELTPDNGFFTAKSADGNPSSAAIAGSDAANATLIARRLGLSGIRFDNQGFAAHDFMTLMGMITRESLDDLKLASALEATINIGAWDGEDLVGAVRVLTDGYLYATIPDIIVHPEYRRRGIGRELMSRALSSAPTGVVLFGSPPESSGFFERLGCQRAPSGYVLKHKPAPRMQSR